MEGRERKLIRERVFPWRLGYRPPLSVCPTCGAKGLLTFTEQLTEDANHVYQCQACGADVGVVTMYAYCDHWEDYLQKDQWFTPCIHGACPHFEPVGPQNPTRCSHFKPVNRDTADDAFVRLIDGMKSDRLKFDPGGAYREKSMVQGIGSEALEESLSKMKRERIRRLEKEDRK